MITLRKIILLTTVLCFTIATMASVGHKGAGKGKRNKPKIATKSAVAVAKKISFDFMKAAPTAISFQNNTLTLYKGSIILKEEIMPVGGNLLAGFQVYQQGNTAYIVPNANAYNFTISKNIVDKASAQFFNVKIRLHK